MCDLSTKGVFRAIAFEPTDEELQAAIRRANPRSVRNGGSSSSNRRAPPQKAKQTVVELSDSSDDELPDVSAILKDAGSQKDKGKSKEKAKVKGSDDEVCPVVCAALKRLTL